MLPAHEHQLVLLQPQIAPNTGNIGRLCVATGTRLHLVRPMGFVLGDKQLRRSVMDYWPRLQLMVHDDTEAFFAFAKDAPLWFFTTKSPRCYWEATFTPPGYLIFGSESHGIDEAILARFPDRTLRIPQTGNERCLNLSTAAGIGLFEALRQTANPK